MKRESEILDLLVEIIKRNKSKDIEQSYTASLFKHGKQKIANKVGEEAIETITAFLSEGKDEIAEESADLIYHLFVLLEFSGISPDDVFRVLKRRMRAEEK
tara:strand:+ start:27 stop:329 length:303 start_codon:yes stop_codon:yes gene_type:complete